MQIRERKSWRPAILAKPSGPVAAIRRKQRLWWTTAILVGVAMVAFYSVMIPRVAARWRRERNLGIAERAMAQGDLSTALFALRIAAAAGADNLRFHRMAATLAARQRDAAGLAHRKRAVALDPSRENLLAWADDALVLGDLREAAAAVAKLSDLGHDNVSRLRAARLAAARGERATALELFRQAGTTAALRPEANLGEGMVLVSSASAEERRAGEHLLLEAAAEPTTEERALAALLSAATRDRAISSLQPARRMLARPGAPLGSRLLAVGLLASTAPLESDAALSAIKAECRDKPAEAGVVAQFLTEAGRTEDALAWLREIASPAQLRQLPLATAAATALGRLGRWAEMEALLQPARWGAEDSIRLLLLAKAASMRTGRPPVARVQEALREARDQPEALSRLFLQAEAWGMPEAALEIGREVLRLAPSDGRVSERMFALSTRSEDPSVLPRYYEAVLAGRPQDETARASLALLRLLAGNNLRASAQVAREVAARAPDRMLSRMTLALALGREGRAEEGLAELDKIPVRERSPMSAGIRALLLAWAGRHSEAETERAPLLAAAPSAVPPVLRELLRVWPPTQPELLKPLDTETN